MITAPRIVENVQWAYSALAPACVNGLATPVDVSGPTYSWADEVLPYTVPADRWLCIVSASLASKFGSLGRSSYFVLQNAFTVTDVEPSITFSERAPFIIPPGTTINARIWNNETMTPEYGTDHGEAQYMNITMTGFLVDHQPGMTYKTCLQGIYWPIPSS